MGKEKTQRKASLQYMEQLEAVHEGPPLSTPTFDVSGCNFIVTGGTQGLGLEIAHQLRKVRRLQQNSVVELAPLILWKQTWLILNQCRQQQLKPSRSWVIELMALSTLLAPQSEAI